MTLEKEKSIIEIIFEIIFRIEFYSVFFLSIFWLLDCFGIRQLLHNIPNIGWIFGFSFGMLFLFEYSPLSDLAKLIIKVRNHEKT